MPTYKLTYFNIKGLGEGIRLILSYMGKEFEDNRIAFPTDPSSPWLKMKSEMKFGRLPILEIDGQEVTQSSAICRYLADEAGLLGSNAWENLQIDIIAGTLKDIAVDIRSMFLERHSDQKAKKMKEFNEKTIPFYFEKFDDIVKNGGYLANGKLSWVDLWFLGCAETVEALAEEPLFDKYTNLKALKEKVYAIPNIKKWIDNRPEYLF